MVGIIGILHHSVRQEGSLIPLLTDKILLIRKGYDKNLTAPLRLAISC